MNITKHSLTEIAAAIASKNISSEEVTAAYLSAIEQKDKKTNGYITVCRELALSQAKKADETLSLQVKTGRLHGIPIAIKDNICTKGILTTCASKILESYTPIFNATVVDKLTAEGAIIIGKTNMDEFAMGSSTENSFFGPTKNPLDSTRIPGGSSGGSAAVVADETAPAALGSDTGGSIRQPAACCGVVGLKPTYGRVSRYGLVAFGSSLDQIGPITQTVSDAALLLNIIAGDDPKDSTTANRIVPDYLSTINSGVAGFRVGIPAEYFAKGLHPAVKGEVMRAAEKLQENGAELVDISLPHTEYAVAAYYVIATAEATSNLARFDGVKYGYRSSNCTDLTDLYSSTRSEGFGSEVKRRIMLCNFVLSSGYYDAYYNKAQQVRTLIQNDFIKAFEKCDLMISPTMPTPPFRLGEKSADPLSMYLSDIYTISANLAGIPGLTVPFGSADDMPVGIQLFSSHFEEQKLFRAGRVIELFA